MEDRLIILQTSTPLKAIIDVQDILEDVLCSVITDLLSLKDDSAKKLLQSVPAIKKHCWSMGLKEVVTMFTMYADGELSIQPRSNYFDRVLVGQIFNSYKQQKKVPKKVPKEIEMSKEDKDNWVHHGLICCFDDYIQTGEIIDGRIWVHDHLQDLGLIKIDEIEKKVLWEKANRKIPEYKKLRLAKIFDVLEAKVKHLKDIL